MLKPIQRLQLRELYDDFILTLPILVNEEHKDCLKGLYFNKNLLQSLMQSIQATIVQLFSVVLFSISTFPLKDIFAYLLV